jgi:hypothetical protein
MRPQNWERFSFGGWLEQAAERLHRNKLATALANKLARDRLGRAASRQAIRYRSSAG